MSFKDLEEFFDPALRLPIRSKTYVIASPDARTGMWCQKMIVTATTAAAGGDITEADIESLELDDEQEQTLYQRLLGETLTQMQDDGVPWEWIKHAGMTAFLWVASNRDAAEAFWNVAPGEPKRRSRRSVSAAKKSAPQASPDSSTSQPPAEASDSPASS